MMRTCQQSHVQLSTKLVASVAAVLAKQQWWGALDALLRAQALPLLSQCPGLVQAIVEGGHFALLPVILPKVHHQPCSFWTTCGVKFLPASLTSVFDIPLTMFWTAASLRQNRYNVCMAAYPTAKTLHKALRPHKLTTFICVLATHFFHALSTHVLMPQAIPYSVVVATPCHSCLCCAVLHQPSEHCSGTSWRC